MVARLDRVTERTHGVGRGVLFKDRPAHFTFRTLPGQAVELVTQFGRQAPRQVLPARGEDVGGEPARVLYGGQGIGGLVDADEG